MIQKITWYFGYLMTAVGILGFLPFLVINGNLLGIFEVSFLHNFVHLATGLVALYVANMNNENSSKMFFKVFGVVYGLVAILGLLMGGNILGLIMVNMYDNLLHIVITAGALYIGFMM